MKTRLICLALCLLFILSAGLTGCKKKTRDDNLETIIEESSADNKTISLWLVTENTLAESVKNAVNQAVNEITQAKFSTYVFINFLTEDEYYNTVSDEIRAYEDSRNSFATAPVEQTKGVKEGNTWYVAMGDEKIYTLPEGQKMAQRENGEWYIAVGKDRFEKRYPLIKAHQVDLVYIGDLGDTIDGETMYTEFVGNGWLTSLDSELSSSSKKIKEYLPSILLEAAKVAKNTYAIPNNRELGEYTFMLLDQELMDETFMNGKYNQGEINGFFNPYIFSYLESVRAKNGNDQPVVDASYEYCLNLLSHYWAIDPETYQTQNDVFSVLGYRYTDPATLSKGQTILSFDSLFADETFRENFTKLNQFDMQGFFKNSDEQTCERPAIRFETGNYARYEELLASVDPENESGESGYYPVIVKYPTVDANEVYSSMFGVCSYSVDLAASMRVLTYMNTNSDFRNLLQYGVEGEHYKMNEENTAVERLLDEDNNPFYMMDIYKTGNAFLAYPDPALNMKADVWENAKDHNLDLKLDPMLGFDFSALVKKSGQSAAEAPKIGSSGYVYTYEYGYSAAIASQNVLLKKWIDQSNAAGKGVYVLHTGVLDGQNFSGKIYYYNNNITGAKVTVADGDPAGTLTVNYTGTAGDGSDITVITFNGKKNSSALSFGATVNGSAVDTTVTYQNSMLNFDFFNTESYTVDFDANVTKAMILENDVVWSWISEQPVNTNASVASYNQDGKYTYVVYVPLINKQYTVSFQPTVNGTELNLNLDYKSTEAALEKSAVTYAIFTITGEIEAPMTAVNLNLTVNGTAVAAADMQTFESDPRFAISGTLDVELVKYISDLNGNVNSILADFKATKNAEAFKLLVRYFGDLLKVQSLDTLYNGKLTMPALPEEAYFFGANATAEEKAAYANLQSFVESLDKDELYRTLLCATSSAQVGHKGWDSTGEKLVEIKKISDIYSNDTTMSAVDENYVYYSSPYALYFAWLKENGYAK